MDPMPPIAIPLRNQVEGALLETPLKTMLKLLHKSSIAAIASDLAVMPPVMNNVDM